MPQHNLYITQTREPEHWVTEHQKPKAKSVKCDKEGTWLLDSLCTTGAAKKMYKFYGILALVLCFACIYEYPNNLLKCDVLIKQLSQQSQSQISTTMFYCVLRLWHVYNFGDCGQLQHYVLANPSHHLAVFGGRGAMGRAPENWHGSSPCSLQMPSSAPKPSSKSQMDLNLNAQA